MNQAFKVTVAAAALSLSSCTQVPAEPSALTEGSWTLDSDASRLSYVTIKAGDIAETNEFTSLSGNVSADGTAQVKVDLASVSTGIDIRDERMRGVLFEVEQFPSATVSTKVDPTAFESLSVGESIAQPVSATLSLKGAEITIDTELEVTRLGEDRVLVVSTDPVIIDAGALGLTDGLAQLAKLASLPSITPATPVTFSFAFER